MGQWVVTVAGIAILSVLCDVILPEGQTRKYIKTVVGIVVTLVMLQPIVNLIDVSRNSGTQPSSSQVVTVQQSYLDMVLEKENSLQALNVKNVLQARGITVENVSISKTDKTVTVQVGVKQSGDVQKQINDIFKTYFDGYKITIKWK